MSYALILTGKAAEDLKQISAYSQIHSPAAAKSFISELIIALDFLKKYPEAAPRAFQKIRKKVLPTFPVNIYFIVKPRKQQIIIARIWHQKRDLSKFKE